MQCHNEIITHFFVQLMNKDLIQPCESTHKWTALGSNLWLIITQMLANKCHNQYIHIHFSCSERNIIENITVYLQKDRIFLHFGILAAPNRPSIRREIELFEEKFSFMYMYMFLIQLLAKLVMKNIFKIPSKILIYILVKFGSSLIKSTILIFSSCWPNANNVNIFTTMHLKNTESMVR